MADISPFALDAFAFAAGLGLGALAGAKFVTLGFIALLRDGTLKASEPRP
ncbi:MAG: hypothetical protein ACRYGP_16950 [Janthinobacterium lividum]